MSTRLEYEDEDEAHNDEHQEKDTFSTAGVSLIVGCNVEFLHCFLDMQRGLLDVIFHTI